MLMRCIILFLYLIIYPIYVLAGSPEGHSGLELVLNLPKTVFRQGEAMPAIVEAINVGTSKPVAASFCMWFGFSYQNIETKESVYEKRAPLSCGQDPFHDNDRELQQRHSIIFKLADIGLHLKPGHYLLMSSWNSSVVGKETLLFGPRYAAVGSNIISVTIVP